MSQNDEPPAKRQKMTKQTPRDEEKPKDTRPSIFFQPPAAFSLEECLDGNLTLPLQFDPTESNTTKRVGINDVVIGESKTETVKYHPYAVTIPNIAKIAENINNELHLTSPAAKTIRGATTEVALMLLREIMRFKEAEPKNQPTMVYPSHVKRVLLSFKEFEPLVKRMKDKGVSFQESGLTPSVTLSDLPNNLYSINKAFLEEPKEDDLVTLNPLFIGSYE